MTAVPQLRKFGLCPVQWKGLGTCLCKLYKYTKQKNLEVSPGRLISCTKKTTAEVYRYLTIQLPENYFST